MRLRLADITSHQFGRLTAQWPAGFQGKSRKTIWLCLCSCGRLKVIRMDHLRRGLIRSCGCFSKEIPHNLKHGEAGGRTTAEYRAWNNMKNRCNARFPRRPGFQYWAGAGVHVCERWTIFENFLADMGRRPTSEHSIDRFPDNNGNYEPGNCRWTTPKQQFDNRRDRGTNAENV